MKNLLYLSMFFFIYACNKSVSKDEIKKLNGYWQIDQVTFANGTAKNYTISPTIDYFEVDGLKGFRKKVQPKFNGTFQTSNDAAYFTIMKKEANFEISYLNDKTLDNNEVRTETILEISDDRFSVINQDSLTFSYKRFQAINATKE